MKTRFVLYCLICLAACQKKSIAPLSAPTPRNGELELLWRQPLLPDSSESPSMSPIIFGDDVVFSASGQLDGKLSPLLFLDTSDGGLKKVWSDWASRPSFFLWESQQYKDNLLFLSNQDFINVINLSTREGLWQTKYVQQGYGMTYVIGDYVYRDAGSGGSTCTLWRSPLTREDWQPVYTYTANDLFSVGFCCLTEARLPNGDQLLLFKNRQWHRNRNIGRLDVFCYNLTADSLLWRNKGLEKWDGGVIPLQVSDSSVFCLGDEKAFALDLYTGAKRWEFDYRARSSGDHFGFGDLFINGDRLIIKPSGEQLFALDKQSGDLLWWRNDMGWSMDGRFTFFEDKLFYVADAEIFIVDSYSGEPLLSESEKPDLGTLTGDIRIDKHNRLLFVASLREAFCLKIPRDW